MPGVQDTETSTKSATPTLRVTGKLHIFYSGIIADYSGDNNNFNSSSNNNRLRINH